MAYKYLNRFAVLEHLQEGQTVNIDEYIEKLRFFKKYTDSQGTYITDRRYIEYSEIGLHYYKFDTLIKFFENFKHENDTKKYEVVRSCMVGATYYAAVKATVLSTGEVETFAAVALTHTNNRDYFNFGVKTMEESMGPCEDHCPASILSLLSPTDSEYANNWRERCRKNIEAKKDPHALKNLPVGAAIRFTLHTGESIELLKHAAAYQFKRPFWFCQSSSRYMPATRIPANYEVVTA